MELPPEGKAGNGTPHGGPTSPQGCPLASTHTGRTSHTADPTTNPQSGILAHHIQEGELTADSDDAPAHEGPDYHPDDALAHEGQGTHRAAGPIAQRARRWTSTMTGPAGLVTH